MLLGRFSILRWLGRQRSNIRRVCVFRRLSRVLVCLMLSRFLCSELSGISVLDRLLILLFGMHFWGSRESCWSSCLCIVCMESPQNMWKQQETSGGCHLTGYGLERTLIHSSFPLVHLSVLVGCLKISMILYWIMTFREFEPLGCLSSEWDSASRL